MKNREKLSLFIKVGDLYYRLFNIIQIGKDGDIDLKITNLLGDFLYQSDGEEDDSGYMTEEEFGSSVPYLGVEMSYHKDGSPLYKFKKTNGKVVHQNPFGTGIRITPPNYIKDFLPIISIALRRVPSCKAFRNLPTPNNLSKNYYCDNDELFEINGKYLLFIYLRNNTQIVNRFTTPYVYSDIIANLNDEEDICIFLQRHQFEGPFEEYSKIFGGYYTPYLYNTFSICSSERKDEMLRCFSNSVFNEDFNKIIKIIRAREGNDKIIHFGKGYFSDTH